MSLLRRSNTAISYFFLGMWARNGEAQPTATGSVTTEPCTLSLYWDMLLQPGLWPGMFNI